VHNKLICSNECYTYHFAKLHAPCHKHYCRTNTCLHDRHLVCASHCISKFPLCLVFLHVYHFGDILEYFDSATTYTTSNYKSLHVYHFHGDVVFDPRTDLSQGGGDDAEHPTIIPMDMPPSLQPSSVPITRVHRRANGTEVTSFHIELPFDSLETWMLPHAWTLCILRYTQDDHGESKEEGQA
jgi:hypothetical protein